jgi:hypothetical protein
VPKAVIARLEARRSKTMMKSHSRTESQTRRAPLPEWQNDKGRKHEAFEVASLGCDRRSVARALRFDRKR